MVMYHFQFSEKAEKNGNNCRAHICDSEGAICNPYMGIDGKLVMKNVLEIDLCKSCHRIAEKREIPHTHIHSVVSLTED
jgi:hypothetical protein